MQKGYFWSNLENLSHKYICLKVFLPSVGVWCLYLRACVCWGRTHVYGYILILPLYKAKVIP